VLNREGRLRPGLYAYATIIVEEDKDVLTIPTTAVVQEKDKAFCVTAVGGRAVRRTIKIGLSDGTRTEVTSGLEGGERESPHGGEAVNPARLQVEREETPV
jgi:HlyD family secretion protein